MSTENDRNDKQNKKKGKANFLSPLPQQQPSQDQTAVPQQPDVHDPLKKLVEAHKQFVGAFKKMLWYAKEGGEALLSIQRTTGKRGATLFDHVREQAELTASNRTFFLYIQVASQWNKLKVLAGDDLDDMGLNEAVKLLQEKKEEKATKKPAPSEGQPKTNTKEQQENTKEQQENTNEDDPADEDGHAAKDSTADEEAEAEKPIVVPPPFDMPQKDRLASLYAQNGPAPSPIQLMNNLVIPSLKRVTEIAISNDDVPFLSNAIHEALALIEVLKLKYAIA